MGNIVYELIAHGGLDRSTSYAEVSSKLIQMRKKRSSQTNPMKCDESRIYCLSLAGLLDLSIPLSHLGDWVIFRSENQWIQSYNSVV